MAYPHYRSQFGDTTFTKVFVGGLAWETPTEEMRSYFHQFGEILEAVIITDKNTSKSKGYGFVTFRDPESARRACLNPNPVIDGRRANCNIAAFGRPRPSPPRGRTQSGINVNPYQGNTVLQQPAPPPPPPPSYGGIGMATPLNHPPLPPPPPPVIYSPYGYPAYSPEFGYQSYPHQQTLYNNPQVVQQAQYYYGYSVESSSGSQRPATFSHRLLPPTPPSPVTPPSYLYYHPASTATTHHFQPSFSNYPPTLIRHRFSSTDSQTSQQTPTDHGEGGGVVTPGSPST